MVPSVLASLSMPKVSPTLSDYHHWVIKQLAGITAPTETTVAGTIIGRWIDENAEGYLARHEVTFARYKEETGAEDAGKILSMDEKKDRA